jgi:4-hydroxybenzoate polyprenyltransferase
VAGVRADADLDLAAEGDLREVRLAASMLRYRVASLLVPFFLLAPALHGELGKFRWSYVAGIVALFASYVVATCVNDIFDVEIDRVNAPDRPLASGRTTRRTLVITALVAAVIALVLAPSPALMALSLLFNVLYSAPPVRICSRPHLAAPSLAIAYVALPYGLGLAAAGVAPSSFDARTVAALVVLFTGRMLLKDFRDRRGDAMFGKRTFLLVHGKRATVVAVVLCVVAGDALLISVLPSAVLIAVVQTFFAAIAFELYRLEQGEDELAAIARGARMGNAVILTWLGFSVLPAAEANVLAVALGALYWLVYLLPAPAATTTAASSRETAAAESARAS